MRYLKTWMGVISGGREDGHPERKFRYYDDINELAKDFGKYTDEEYYELNPLNEKELKLKVKESLEKQKEVEKEKKKQNIESQIKQLQNQLKELS